MTWYDTQEGIKDALDKGIAGLGELRKARHEAGYDRKERMDEWCVLGYFYLSSNGNFDKICENAPRDRRRHIEVKDVMTKDEALEATGGRWSTTSCRLPPIVEKCDRCLLGWDTRNIDDYEDYRRDENEPHRHKRCKKLMIFEDEQEFFKEIMERSELPYTSMRAIPNEYHSELYSNPWFIVESEWGAFRVGYRKRVISIDWSDTKLELDGKVIFKKEGVTTWATGVHAYGKDKAIEYLRTLSREAPDGG